MTQTALDLREGRAIADMLNAKAPASGIAAEIGRHRATICREIERNACGNDDLSWPSGDCGATAHRSAEAGRARRRKPVRVEDLRDAVILQLTEGDSVPRRGVGAPTFEEVRVWSGRHGVRPDGGIVGDARFATDLASGLRKTADLDSLLNYPTHCRALRSGPATPRDHVVSVFPETPDPAAGRVDVEIPFQGTCVADRATLCAGARLEPDPQAGL
jgi:hypothetical protein